MWLFWVSSRSCSLLYDLSFLYGLLQELAIVIEDGSDAPLYSIVRIIGSVGEKIHVSWKSTSGAPQQALLPTSSLWFVSIWWSS
eukprot:m.243613 g.243613  ORF g.243613 m.243613 type:complete len:84 (+) comp17142_c0_seq3:1568-1819(+)